MLPLCILYCNKGVRMMGKYLVLLLVKCLYFHFYILKKKYLSAKVHYHFFDICNFQNRIFFILKNQVLNGNNTKNCKKIYNNSFFFVKIHKL